MSFSWSRPPSNGKLLIKPSRQNVKTFLDGIRHIIKSNAQITAGELIARLNPKIKGWTMYHRHVSSSKTFTQIDHAIFQALWRWAVRRLERYDWKLSRTVLRGLRGSNAPRLPDSMQKPPNSLVQLSLSGFCLWLVGIIHVLLSASQCPLFKGLLGNLLILYLVCLC